MPIRLEPRTKKALALALVLTERVYQEVLPKQVQLTLREFGQEPAKWGLEPFKQPSYRSIERGVHDFRKPGGPSSPPPDDSGDWSVLEADVEELEAVLPARAALTELYKGPRVALTVNQARQIARLRRADPSMPPLAAYQLANAYIRAKADGAHTASIDDILAFAPWRSKDHEQRFKRARDEGWIARGDAAADWLSTTVTMLDQLLEDQRYLDALPRTDVATSDSESSPDEVTE